MLSQTLRLVVVVQAAAWLIGSACAEDKITFDDHIKPIFREHCLTCHNQNDKKSDLALDTYGATMAGGSGGEIVVASDLDSSRLWELVAHVAQPYMPPNQDKLPDAKLNLIKQWIGQGMPENSGSAVKKKNNAAAAMLTSASIGKPAGPPPMPESLLKQPAIFTPRPAAIAALAASPWAPLVAVAGQQQVALYHTETGQLLGIIPFPEGEPQSLTFTRDGRQLLIGGGRHGSSGCAVLVDIASGNRIAKVGEELDIVLASDITPDKRQIALGGPQKLIRIFDTASGELVREIKKHTDWIYALRYSPDGILLASADRSNGLMVWEAESGRIYADLVGHKGEIRALDFRADSNLLASASMDGTVKLWDMMESKLQKSFDAHGGGATSVAFTQDGNMATSGRDGKVKFWSGDGTMKAEFTGLTEAALEVAVPGNGAQLIGGDWNGRVQLWQVADAKQTVFLAANPPTLAQVLEQAKAAATASQVTLVEVTKVATDATAKLTEGQSQLASSDQALKTATDQLTAAQQVQQKLTTEVTNQTAVIADLEAKLAAAKLAKEQMVAALTVANDTLAKSAAAAEAAKVAQAAAKAKHDEIAAAAQTANAKQGEVAAQAKVAADALARAEADLAAFNKTAAELKAQADKVATDSAAVQKKMLEVTQAEATRQVTLKTLTDEMQKLQAEMAALQAKITATAAQQASAQTELTSTQTTATELKAALEKAQQDAAAASEKLKLFAESYK